jgi:CO/xanthine dehydrogenase FAD-binding subunit
MKNGNARPAVIVDAKKIPELNRLEWNDDKSLYIGAAVPLSKIITFPPVAEKFGILYQACSIIGSMQLRNREQLVVISVMRLLQQTVSLHFSA